MTLRPLSMASVASVGALVGATLATWMLAVGVTQIVGGACLPLRDGALLFRTEVAAAPTSSTVAPEKKIRATTIVSHDPFDSTTHAPTTAPALDERPCGGNFRLVATAIDDAVPERSIAILESASGTALDAPLVRVGSSIDGSRVISVGSSRVWLRDPRGACFVGAGARSGESAGVVVKGADADAAIAGIRRIDDTHVAVERSLRDALLQDPQALMRSLVISPETTNGKTTGVRLTKVSAGSIFHALNLRAGDVLRSINGFDVSSPEKMLEAFAALKTAPALQIDLARDGAPTTLNVEIR